VREAVVVREVTHTYESGPAAVRALSEVSATFEPERFHVVAGPSGSGKTTLLMVLGLLLSPDRGEVRLGERVLSGLPEGERASLRRRHVGFVFQSFRLFRALDALENVGIALDIRGKRDGEAREAARAALASVGLADRASHRPHELSGGQKQRVAIARALVSDPDVLLADEPTAALDSASGKRVMELLARLAHDEGRVVIAVTHDPRVLPLADRVLALEDGAVVSDRRERT
jgi:putative ABC transport system ATP-binding protein